MNRRDEIRREIEAVLDDMTEEAGVGVSRAPAPEDVVPPVVEEPAEHDHLAHGMVTFSQWGEDEDGNLVALDPERFGFWDLEAEEKARAEELAGHAGHGGHGGDEEHAHDAPPTRKRRSKPDH